jgi:hypothetical protein
MGTSERSRNDYPLLSVNYSRRSLKNFMLQHLRAAFSMSFCVDIEPGIAQIEVNLGPHSSTLHEAILKVSFHSKK